MENTFVSIVSPAFDYAQYLPECIQSCLNQTYKNFEVIIVDDGSTDNTKEVCSRYPVRYIYQENHGLPHARNTGIKAALGSKILLLDADDKIDDTFLEKTVNIPGVAVVGVKNFDEANAEVLPYHDLSLEAFKVQNRITITSLFDKKDWEAVGGFDESMKLGREDWDFWLRLLKLGVPFTPVNECLFYYRIHGHTMARQADALQDQIHKYIHDKHPDLFGNNSSLEPSSVPTRSD